MFNATSPVPQGIFFVEQIAPYPYEDSTSDPFRGHDLEEAFKNRVRAMDLHGLKLGSAGGWIGYRFKIRLPSLIEYDGLVSQVFAYTGVEYDQLANTEYFYMLCCRSADDLLYLKMRLGERVE